MNLAGRKILVTGGGGFLGGAIVGQLIARGARVRSFSRGDHSALARLGAESMRGDVADAAAVARACVGCEVVIHAAAKAGVWGPRREFERANILGTQNVIDACRRAGVRALVHTSSPSVVFDGRDMEGADERAPYPAHYHADYPRTKAEAERRVLAANGPDLATVALRPHLIWGPGDPHLAARIVARARAGRLRLVGEGRNRIDTIYVDNAAEAHVLAAERLAPGAPIAGRAYFISQGEPVELRAMIDRILAAAGLPPVRNSISPGAAFAVGAVLEFAYKTLGLRGEPIMTRFLARELATSHWFDISAARRDLGYEPKVSAEEGLRRLKAWFEAEARTNRR